MAQLILFLVYLAIIAALVWQVILLIRVPSARAPARLLAVIAGAAVMAGIVYFGVFN